MRCTLMLIILTVMLSGCFPAKEVIHVDANWLRQFHNRTLEDQRRSDTSAALPAKVFTHDGGIHLFPDGFTIGGDAIQGTGMSYALGSKKGVPLRSAIPLDSITVVGYQKKTHTAGEVTGSIMLATWLIAGLSFTIGSFFLVMGGVG